MVVDGRPAGAVSQTVVSEIHLAARASRAVTLVLQWATLQARSRYERLGQITASPLIIMGDREPDHAEISGESRRDTSASNAKVPKGFAKYVAAPLWAILSPTCEPSTRTMIGTP